MLISFVFVTGIRDFETNSGAAAKLYPTCPELPKGHRTTLGKAIRQIQKARRVNDQYRWRSASECVLDVRLLWCAPSHTCVSVLVRFV